MRKSKRFIVTGFDQSTNFFFPSQFNTSQTITRGASTWSIVLEWCMFYETCVSAKTCNEHFHLSGILQLHVVMCFQAKGFTVG